MLVVLVCEKRPLLVFAETRLCSPIERIHQSTHGSLSPAPDEPKSGRRLAQLNDVILNLMNVRFVFDVLNSNVGTPYRFRHLI
jgi:hypothetical protein